MSEDEGPRNSFEDAMRALADELRKSFDRASQTDADDLARAAGLDPDNLPVQAEEKPMYRSRDERPKTWKDIWGAGQGVGNIEAVLPTRVLVDRIVDEYEAAKAKICASKP